MKIPLSDSQRLNCIQVLEVILTLVQDAISAPTHTDRLQILLMTIESMVDTPNHPLCLPMIKSLAVIGSMDVDKITPTLKELAINIGTDLETLHGDGDALDTLLKRILKEDT